MTFLQGNMFQGDTLPNPGDAIARATVATSPTSSINVRTSSNTTTSRSPTTTTSGSSSSTTTCGGSILARNSKSGSGKGVVYLLHSILHNWGTQDALTILRWVAGGSVGLSSQFFLFCCAINTLSSLYFCPAEWWSSQLACKLFEQVCCVSSYIIMIWWGAAA
jgi:hypothetical protein